VNRIALLEVPTAYQFRLSKHRLRGVAFTSEIGQMVTNVYIYVRTRLYFHLDLLALSRLLPRFVQCHTTLFSCDHVRSVYDTPWLWEGVFCRPLLRRKSRPWQLERQQRTLPRTGEIFRFRQQLTAAQPISIKNDTMLKHQWRVEWCIKKHVRKQSRWLLTKSNAYQPTSSQYNWVNNTDASNPRCWHSVWC
jgi:hypothetical protein